MRQEMGTPGHPEVWYYALAPYVALASMASRDAAIEMLRRASRASSIGLPCTELRTSRRSPSCARTRAFQALMRQLRSRLDEQRRELDRLRAEGVVPGPKRKPGAPAELPDTDASR